MTAENLAICFAPTILRPAEEGDIDPMQAMKNVQPAIAAVKMMIINFRSIFSANNVKWAHGLLNIEDPLKRDRENKLLYGGRQDREKRCIFEKIEKVLPKRPTVNSPPVPPLVAHTTAATVSTTTTKPPLLSPNS